MPGRAGGSPQLARVGTGVDDDVAALDGVGQRHQCATPPGWHGERSRLAPRQLGQRGRRREEVGDLAVGHVERITGRLDESTGDGAGS